MASVCINLIFKMVMSHSFVLHILIYFNFDSVFYLFVRWHLSQLVQQMQHLCSYCLVKKKTHFCSVWWFTDQNVIWSFLGSKLGVDFYTFWSVQSWFHLVNNYFITSILKKTKFFSCLNFGPHCTKHVSVWFQIWIILEHSKDQIILLSWFIKP